MTHRSSLWAAIAIAAAVTPWTALRAQSPGIQPPRVTQAMITSGSMSFREIRTHGLRMFSAPFNKLDGYGDGPMDPLNPTAPGGRPTLQNNGTFLRVNGLDAQTCMECHSVISAATIPFTFGIGGVGGSNNNAMALPTTIDVSDQQGNGFAAFDGRYINPPFLFGAGGVELVGKEMTSDLQRLKQRAINNPGRRVRLRTHGVDFGSIVYRNGHLDTSALEGVEEDLVVRPFGRKGEFPTTRSFDIEAMQFHFGMQPAEVIGPGVDGDGDGVVNEILVGELSALHVFATTLERPEQRGRINFRTFLGRQVFEAIGCADCHVPEIETRGSRLTYSFPQVPEDPTANVYYSVDLRQWPMRFQSNRNGGVRVPMFSDLKRHDMGPELAESTGGPLDPFFITPRLWGIADTAPYLHDGRALTLEDAILMHGGEAQAVRDRFASLRPRLQRALIAFLNTLKAPTNPAKGLDVNSLFR